MFKLLRTFVIDAAVVAVLVALWRNPAAGAQAATQAYSWVDQHVRPLLQSSDPPPSP